MNDCDRESSLNQLDEKMNDGDNSFAVSFTEVEEPQRNNWKM